MIGDSQIRADRPRRLFFALWPDAALRQCLHEVGGLIRPDDHGRCVVGENLHLTLLFLDTVTPDRQACLEAGAREIALAPFSFSLDHLGFWQAVETVWLGCRDPVPELLELARSLVEVAGDCGLSTDSRPYHPHVSLVRRQRQCPELPHIDAVTWEARDFVLALSDTRSSGAFYTVLRRWKLG